MVIADRPVREVFIVVTDFVDDDRPGKHVPRMRRRDLDLAGTLFAQVQNSGGNPANTRFVTCSKRARSMERDVRAFDRSDRCCRQTRLIVHVARTQRAQQSEQQANVQQ